MAVDAFIPEIWDATLFTALEDTLVYCDPGTTVNTDYEGEISQAGDTVHIGTLADPVIKNYTRNSTVIVPDQLSISDQTLVIDQSKYYAIGIDDLDKAQALNGGSLLTKGAQRAAYQMRATIDQFMATKMVAGAGNVIPAAQVTPTATDADGPYAVLVKLKSAMDKAKLPLEGRWVIADPEFANALLWDQRFTSATNHADGGSVINNGVIGRALGFTIKTSTVAPVGATAAAGGNSASRWLIAGAGTAAATYAQQLSKTEGYRPESSFGDAIKGLALYGGKVVRPEFLVKQDVLVTA